MAGYDKKKDSKEAFTPKKGANNGVKKGQATIKTGDRAGQIVSWVSGWNFNKERGLVTVMIGEYEGTKTTVAPTTGKHHTVLMANVTYKRSGVEKHYPVTLCKESGLIVLEKDGYILNVIKGSMTLFDFKKR
jgi:hypothetical protein